MEDQEKLLQVLLDAGMPESVASSMLKTLEPKPDRKKRKFYGTSTKREKINIPVVVVKTCLTCNTKVSFKAVMQTYSDEADTEHQTFCSLCENCIRLLGSMDKEQLVALIIIQNHPDLELRKFSTATQIKMAKQKSPIAWLTTKVPHAIAWGDKDKEGFVELPETDE